MARRRGFKVSRSRARVSVDNAGGLMLVDAVFNHIELGARFDASPEDIIEYLRRPS